MSAPNEIAVSLDDKIAARPTKSGDSERQSPDADLIPLAHEALLALARLLGRQAAIESMKTPSATPTSMMQDSIP